MLCRWQPFSLRWLVAGLLVCLVSRPDQIQAQDLGIAVPDPISRVSSTLPLTGVGSCAAAGCHGGDGRRKKPDGTIDISATSYSTWIQRDPHARAYDVLLNERSRNIVRQLGAGWQAAHEERRCLVCHSAVEPAAFNSNPQIGHELSDAGMLQDGVSCESCHGPAEKWLAPHTERTWRTRSAESRAALGFVDLRTDLVGRAATCVKCHVGGEGRDVNHDLIAAGHPRLNFELAAYHANIPAHWNVSDDRRAFPSEGVPQGSMLEARLWVVGQLTTADASLSLLESRARAARADLDQPAAAGKRPAVWPEFSEYGCFACHHDLQAPSWRQNQEGTGRPLGSYPWGTWNFRLLKVLDPTPAASPLTEALRSLGETMGHPAPELELVLSQSKLARELVSRELANHTQPNSLTALRVRDLLQRVTRDGQDLAGQDWDAAAQVYLGTVALYQGRLEVEGRTDVFRVPSRDDRETLRALETIREKLQFPRPPETPVRFDSPRNFNDQRIRVIREQLQRVEQMVK